MQEVLPVYVLCINVHADKFNVPSHDSLHLQSDGEVGKTITQLKDVWLMFCEDLKNAFLRVAIYLMVYYNICTM